MNVSADVDLHEVMERVDHAFVADGPGKRRVRGGTYSAIVDASRVRFMPGDAGDVTATIALNRFERGELAADTAAAGDAFVLGNTRQRRILLGGADVVEHVEARAEEIELTWVLSAAPEGDGTLQLAFGIDGLTPLGRTTAGHHFADASGTARVRISDAVLRDSAGMEWKLPLVEEADGLALDVPATILASARYPLAIDPVISAELGMDTPIIGPAAVASPKIECGAGTCLAVWQDARTGTQALYGTLFDPSSGQVLNPLGLKLVENTSGLVDVTFTGTDFLVVTNSNSATVGRRVTTAGTTPDPPFAFGTFGGSPTAIASTGTTSLAVRTTNSGNIEATLLSGTTVVTHIPISTDPSSEQAAEVAWDGSAFVVTWWRFSSDYDTMIARVGVDGTILSAPAVLAGGAGFQYLTRVCGGSPGALAVWHDSATGTNRAQRFDDTFTPVGGVISLGAMGTSIACASDGSRYLVIAGARRNVIDKATGAVSNAAPGISNGASWVDPDATHDGTRFIAVYRKPAGITQLGYAQRFASDATTLDQAEIPLQSLASEQSSPVTASIGSQYAVVWTEQGTTGRAVRGVLLDDTGTPLDPAGFTLAPSSDGAPALTTSSNGYFAVWNASNGQIVGRRLATTGGLGPLVTIATGSTTKTSPRVTFDGQRFITTWYEFNSPNVNVRVANVSTSDVPSAPYTLESMTPTTAHGAVHAACLPSGRCAVAWTNPSAIDVQMELLQDGAPLDGIVRTIAAGPGTDRLGSMTTDGTSFLVNYQTSSGWARRVAADGTLLGEPIALPFSVFNPASSFDGTHYVLAGAISNTNTITLSRVTTAGAALGAYDLTLPYPTFSASLTRAAGSKRSLLVYSVYDEVLQNRRAKGRFIAFTSAPTTQDDTYAVVEDTPRAITLSATDSDGDPLSYTIVSGPTNGTLSGTAPNLTYTPGANYSGTDSFSFKVNDGNQDSNTSTISLTVGAVNDAPVANNSSTTTDEDVPVAVALNATDIEGSTLTYTILSGPAHGTLSGTGATRTYTPAANYHGTDSFTFSVSDGQASSNTATVTITIAPIDDAPIAIVQSATVAEDGAVAIVLTGNDLDGDPLSFAVVGGPAQGTLAGTAPNLTYTPAPNYHGGDSFTFRVNDGTSNSPTATVSITVTPVNDAPIANLQATSVAEDASIAITLTGSDIDDDSLTFTTVTGPSHGTLTGSGANRTYTPAANYNGPDAFTFRATDGSAVSNTATVSITVTPVNDAPVANAQATSVAEDNSVAITLTGSDPENDALTYSVVAGPTHGTLSGSGANRTYTPAANYHGPDAFTFRVDDGTSDSPTATVSITVTPVNDAPMAIAQTTSVAEDGSVAVTLTGSDVDGDTLSFTVVTGPAHGTLGGTGANVTYTPTTNYVGPDSFTFRVNDGTLDSLAATVSITVTPVNDPPIAIAQATTLAEDNSVAITLSGSDTDGDALTYAVVSGPAHGTLGGTAPNLTYTPVANYHGADAFTFTVSDGTATSPTATVSITVSPVNDAPIAIAQSVATIEDNALAIVLSGSDVDGDTLSFTIAAGPTHGTLTGTAPNVTYTPAANYHGADAFTFTVSDGIVGSSAASISISISSSNDAPVATAQPVTTDEDVAVSIALSATDADSDALTYAVVSTPAHGTLTGTPPNVTYTPVANYHGTDSFTFRASDGTAQSNVVTVAIDITPVNDPPIAVAQAAMTAEDVSLGLTLSATDVDGDTLTYAIATPPARGTLTGTPPNVIYTPATNDHGSDTFTFTASDGASTSAATTISLTLTPVDDAPVANAQSLTTDEDTAIAITLMGSDVEGDALTYVVVNAPAHGTLTGSAPNLTYTPAADYHGADELTFEVHAGTVSSAPATVALTIGSVNDAPIATSQDLDVDQGEQVTITLSATDVDGDTLTYAIATDPTDGTLTGTPPELVYEAPTSFRGPVTFTFTASDGTLSSTGTVTVNVNNGAPVVTAAADSANPTEGQVVAFTATAADPGGDPLTFAWDFGDGSSSTDQHPSHAYTDDGTYTATVTVSDGLATASASVELTVQNGAPSIVPATGTVTGDEASELAFAIAVTDPGTIDTHAVTWDWGDNTPSTTGGSAMHTYADNGSYTVTVTVTDNQGASVTGSRDVTIANVAPVPVPQDPLVTDARVEVTAQLSATDRAGSADPLTWALVYGPGALTAEGAYSWTPESRDAGGHVITARVTDDDGGFNDLSFSVEVIATPSDGCGCRTTGTGSGPASLVLMFGVLALVLRRRQPR